MILKANELMAKIRVSYDIEEKADALRKHGLYFKEKKGWFDRIGQFVGVDDDSACSRMELPFVVIAPSNYYIISTQVKKQLLPTTEHTFEVSGLTVWAQFEGKGFLKYTELKDIINRNLTSLKI